MKSEQKHGHEPDDAKPHDDSKTRDYADTDIRFKPIFAFAIFTTVFVVITFIGIEFIFNYFRQESESSVAPSNRFAEERVLPPEPRLQVNERRTLQQQRAIEQAQVEGYGWVDKGAGVVHIPVDRAVELTAERGLPARAAESAK